MPGSPMWSLSLKSPHQNHVYASPLPHQRYMPIPSRSSRFLSPEQYWVRSAESSSSSLCSFFPLPCYPVPLSSKYSPQHPILKHTQPTFHPQCERPSFTPIQNKTKKHFWTNVNIQYDIVILQFDYHASYLIKT
jgi:hypothetical protein